MIFVTTGTVSFPFKRLVDEVLKLYKGKKETVIIQSGVYKIKPPSKNIRVKPYFSFEKTIDLYKKADLIISACGEASVYSILQFSKNMSVFVPRLKKYCEHVDNQQFLIAKYIEKKGLAHVVYEIEHLETFIKRKRVKNKNSLISSRNRNLKRIIKNLNRVTRIF